MHFVGGLEIGTEMMAYHLTKGKQVPYKLKDEHLGIDDRGMVALYSLFGDYDLRFTPVYRAVKALSRYVVRLTFEDGFTVVCSKFQRFFMYDYTWKMAQDLTAEDRFLHVFRHPVLTEFEGDFDADDHEFEMLYVPDDIKPIKLKSSETLPDNKSYVMAVPIDWHSDAIVLANGAVIEGICLSGHPAKKENFDARPE